MRVAAFRQTPAQVFQRVPGDRFLSGPVPARDEAVTEWQLAWLSLAAYERSHPKHAAKQAPATTGSAGATAQRARGATGVDAKLASLGWTRWSDFPDRTLKDEMRESHLRAEVWENRDQKTIVVAFGGTVFSSGKDWRSNLRWFLPKHEDEYTKIVKRFGPDFVGYFVKKMSEPDGAYLREVAIFATGHSLGGGLAQQFAYSLPMEPRIQRVAHVYAFDPSPVTGFYSVRRKLRDFNKTGLKITRTYERGEILAILRSITSAFVLPSVRNPEIRGVRFDLFPSLSLLGNHSMVELATRMEGAAAPGAQDRQGS